MMKRSDEPLSPGTLGAFLEGEVTRSEAAEIEDRLAGCAVSRRHLAQLEDIRTSLSHPPDALEAVDLVASVRQAIAAAPLPPRRVRTGGWVRAGGAAACAAIVVGIAVMWGSSSRHPAEPDEFRGKSAASAVEDRWVRIDVFRVGSAGAAEPLEAGGALRSGDGLVFRYTNSGREPFGYLMVLAVDAAGEVRWYYPAYETAGDNPSSLVIQPGGVGVALPDAVHHELGPGPLVIYGLFSRGPLRVLEIERRLGELRARGEWNPVAPPRLPIADSGQDIVRATVTR